MLLLNQFYWPDTAATAQLLADVAAGLVANGHEVHVLTSRRCYGGGSQDHPAESTTDAGVYVHRVAATGFGRVGLIGRALDYATFYLRAMHRARRLPRMDVCVALTTPPFIASVGWRLKSKRGTKLVLWTMDLYPEIAVAFGMLRAGGVVHRLLARLAKKIYQRADAIICLGDHMRDALMKAGAPPARISVVHNWVPGEAVAPQPPSGGCVTLLYSGNIGMGHELETAVRAIAELPDRSHFRARFIGFGKLRGMLEDLVARLGLGDCVTFSSPCSLDELSANLAAGDIHLVSQRPGTQGLMVPSKIYGILAAARPAIYIGPSDTEVAAILVDAGAGLIVPPGDIRAAAASLQQLIDDSALRGQMGRRAGEYYGHNFGRKKGVQMIAEIVDSVCA